MAKLPEIPEQKIEEVRVMFDKYKRQIEWLQRWRIKFLKPLNLNRDEYIRADHTLAFLINAVYIEHRFVWQNFLRSIEKNAENFNVKQDPLHRMPKYVAYFGLLALNHYTRALKRELEKIDENKPAAFNRETLQKMLSVEISGENSTSGQLNDMFAGKREPILREPMFFGINAKLLPVWYVVAVPGKKMFDDKFIGKELKHLENLLHDADLKLVSLLGEFTKLFPDRLYFMDERERNILSEDKRKYNFLRLYLTGTLDKETYLKNLESFKGQLRNEGVSDSTLEALRNLPEINNLFEIFVGKIETMKTLLKAEMKGRVTILQSNDFEDVIKANDDVMESLRTQNAEWMSFNKDFEKMLKFLPNAEREERRNLYLRILRQIHIHCGYVDE